SPHHCLVRDPDGRVRRIRQRLHHARGRKGQQDDDPLPVQVLTQASTQHQHDMNMLKKTLLSMLALTVAVTVYGFLPLEVITVKGSDTMVILAQQWAEAYQPKHPGVSIQVT